MDDTENVFSPTYNRQNGREITENWSPQYTDRLSDEDSNSAALPIYEDPVSLSHSLVDSQGICRTTSSLPVISIQGLNPEILGPLDFSVPVIRTYPANAKQSTYADNGFTSRGPAVQHVDVTSVWSDLRYTEAQELYRIRQAFSMVLERLLASELWKIFREQDSIQDVARDEDIHNDGVVRGISFCRDQLVEEMADSLYSSQEDMVRSQLGLLRLYLTANDCLAPFQNHSRDTSITVRVSSASRSRVPYPAVEAAWVPDSIVFKGLNWTPCEGQELSIVPRYQSNSAFRSARFPTNVKYSIESQHIPLPWLVWDNHIGGFKGIIPIYSEMRMGGGNTDYNLSSHRTRYSLVPFVKRLCIDIKAVLIDSNGSQVQYKRVVRARLNFEILPWYSWTSDYAVGSFEPRGLDATNVRLRTEEAAHTFPHAMGSTPSQAYCQDVDSHTRGHDEQTRLDIVSQAVRCEAEVLQLPDLAQKHANLAAKYADIAQRHADAEAHVRMLGSLPAFRCAHKNEPYLKISCMGESSLPPFTRRSRHRRLVSNDSGSSGVWQNGPKHGLSPPSPQLRVMRRGSVIEDASNPGFPVLPPPTFRSFSSQTFDECTQSWNRIQSSEEQLSSQRQIPRIGDTEISQASPDVISSREATVLKMQAEPLYGSPMRQHHLKAPVDIDRASSAPCAPNDDENTSKFKESSRKRQVKPSLFLGSPTKRAKEDKQEGDILPSASGITPHDPYHPFQSDTSSANDFIVGRERFLGVQNPVESDDEGPRSSNPRTGPDHLSYSTHLDGLGPATTMHANQVQSSQGIHTPPDSVRSMLLSRSGTAGTQDAMDDFPPTQVDNSGIRAVSLQSWQTRGTLSRTPSSNIAFTVEGPQEILSRSEQAHIWSQLSGSEDSDKENQTKIRRNKPRLSEEEKKSIQAAVDRSLEDLTGGFDDIFLAESDNSTTDGENAEI